MYKLLRYFSIASLMLFAAAVVMMVSFYRPLEIRQLVELTENQNEVLTRAISNVIWPKYANHLINSANKSPDQLRNCPATEDIQATLEDMTDGLPILKVKIYNLDGLTVYSSQLSQIGEDKNGNTGYEAAREGLPASNLVHKNNMTSFSGEVWKRDVVESYVPILSEDGQPLAVFELYTDVTEELKILENGIWQLGVGLVGIFIVLYTLLYFIVWHADKILVRQYGEIQRSRESLQSKNEELLVLRDRALQGSRAKSQFLANMSHELRTPLNSIIGFSSYLKEAPLGPLGHQKYDEYLTDVHDAGRYLLDLVNDILDVSAIEAGALDLQEDNIHLQAAVDTALRIVQPIAEKEGVHLASALGAETPDLLADERRLRQILLNLLSNAIKFTPKGGAVTVSAHLQNDGGLMVTVRDTGIGMSPEEIRKALNLFGQIDSGLDRKHEGSGLGLPLVSGLMGLHGGRMEIDSLRKKGTTVNIFFPEKRVRLQRDMFAGEISAPNKA